MSAVRPDGEDLLVDFEGQTVRARHVIVAAQAPLAAPLVNTMVRTMRIDRGAGHIEDAIEVRGILRAGIDHDRPVASEYIRVGTRPGQRARIRRNDAPPHEVRDARNPAGRGRRQAIDGNR